MPIRILVKGYKANIYLFQSQDDTTILACVHSFNKIFLHLLASEEMYLQKIPDTDEGEHSNDHSSEFYGCVLTSLIRNAHCQISLNLGKK